MEDKLEARFQELEEKLKNLTQEDRARVRDAFDYARSHHEGQLRKDGSPYITHPLEVAHLVAELGLDADSIMAALLHDTIEDTDATHEEVAKRFSETVADLVEGVTKLTKVKYTSTEEKQMENLRKMLMAMAQDVRVILIKICDRVHNIRTLEYQTEKKQREKALETLEIYAPIAHRLGMQRMKWEMEDQSLKFLDPIAYQEISDELDRQAKAHAAFMEHIQEEITTRLEKEGIKGTVYGRVKHVYSIYRKMYAQNKKLSEIFDLYAFRVIVDDIFTCYRVLGDIHDMYRPVLGRFKDYISTPKPNMYQSLHTTVIGSEGIPFEVQIRTRKMDEQAEYGVAAHWKYKEGLDGHDKLDERLAWVSQLLENQRVSEDSGNLLHDLKSDLLPEEVFAFTPKGDVINLPTGATCIDFAYAIHSAVGNRMVGCKVNNRMVPIDHIVSTGEIIEVILGPADKGPSRDWLKIVRTSEAKSKIRNWFKKMRREENITQGRDALARELRREMIIIPDDQLDDFINSCSRRLRQNNAEELYAAIGYGGMTIANCLPKLKEEWQKLKASEEKAGEDLPKVDLSRVHATDGVVVEGFDNTPIKFAKCC
ncbi:RelA/SpoT family protein, partial [Evtepia gabavorous]|uniref:RelA/SpoT family protein n=1 Tax=Evtepia gabavorous TaxID=2211183 RepID=UPI003A956037